MQETAGREALQRRIVVRMEGLAEQSLQGNQQH
jgi:hypothetical protein